MMSAPDAGERLIAHAPRPEPSPSVASCSIVKTSRALLVSSWAAHVSFSRGVNGTLRRHGVSSLHAGRDGRAAHVLSCFVRRGRCRLVVASRFLVRLGGASDGVSRGDGRSGGLSGGVTGLRDGARGLSGVAPRFHVPTNAFETMPTTRTTATTSTPASAPSPIAGAPRAGGRGGAAAGRRGRTESRRSGAARRTLSSPGSGPKGRTTDLRSGARSS